MLRKLNLSTLVFGVAAISLVLTPTAQGQDWKGASSNRYGAAGSLTPPTTPEPTSDSRFGSVSSPNAVAPLSQPSALSSRPLGRTQQPVTPLPGNTPAARPIPAATAGGMTAVGGQALSRVSVSKGPASLPDSHGQVMRVYDISPYTLRQADKEHPEQTVVDWVLRETGYEAWHTAPFGFLSATRERLTVYHTEQMQSVVAGILDRFVNSQAASQAFSLRIATVRNPNWRAKALPLMTPIPVQSPGMQGWIMPKENAAILLSYLTQRSDYREHSASNQMVLNGQQIQLSTMRPRQYIKGVIRTENAWPGFQPETGQLEEGASMEFSPLLSLDMKSADAVMKIRIHQVEKMAKVKLDIPTQITGNQRMEVEVPQMTMANVHERFRWPADHVLLLSMGVVPPPTKDNSSALKKMIPGMNAAPRADGLLMVEVRGTAIPSATPGLAPVSTALRGPGTFSGRY